MGLKVYVAGKYEEAPRVLEVMALVMAQGNIITYNWCIQEQASAKQAILDLRGVADADVVVLVLEKDLPYEGTYAELGAALALGKPVFVLGDSGRRCIFLKHPNVQFVTEEELCRQI